MTTGLPADRARCCPTPAKPEQGGIGAAIAAPLIWLVENSASAALGVLRGGRGEPPVTEEEVKAVIAGGAESGALDPREKELLSGVMRLGDRSVKGIMTPRPQVVHVDLDWEPSRVAATIRGCHHSRFPVCRGGMDEVLGVVQAKDILDALLDGERLDLERLVKQVEVVPNSTAALDVLSLLKRSPIHMAIVVDEYGSMQGMVTVADILAGIVGGLSERGEDYEGKALSREDGSWLLDGNLPVDVAAETLSVDALGSPGSTYETLAGFVLDQMRSLPAEGDAFDWQGWRFQVVDMDGRRVDKVLAQKAA